MTHSIFEWVLFEEVFTSLSGEKREVLLDLLLDALRQSAIAVFDDYARVHAENCNDRENQNETSEPGFHGFFLLLSVKLQTCYYTTKKCFCQGNL
jgi:hypothetical protein